VKYLVDANILSEPTKPVPDGRVVEWLRHHEPDLAVNPIILGELEYGILLLPAGRRRSRLERWFAEGIQRLRVLDFDAATAATWARLLARLKRKGVAMPIKDSLIAATALTHGLSIVADLFIDQGDHLILPDMLWGNYNLTFVTRCGAIVKKFPTFTSDRGFNVAAFRAELKNSAAEKGKVVVLLNFPKLYR